MAEANLRKADAVSILKQGSSLSGQDVCPAHLGMEGTSPHAQSRLSSSCQPDQVARLLKISHRDDLGSHCAHVLTSGKASALPL